MQSSEKFTERVLDSSLLAGSIDVDDYATALLQQNSLEYALRELERVKRQLEEVKKERDQFKQNTSINGASQKKAQDQKFHENPDKKRRFPAVAALYESRSNALESLEPLARIHARFNWEAAASAADSIPAEELWYTDTFSEELKALKSVEQKVASKDGRSRERELELEEELHRLKIQHEQLKADMDVIILERTELQRTNKELSEEQDKLLQGTRDEYEGKIEKLSEEFDYQVKALSEERDDLFQATEDLDIKYRSTQELNKALSQKILLLEERLRLESNRSMRCYDFIFKLKQASRKRQLLQTWRANCIASSTMRFGNPMVIADSFHNKLLMRRALISWKESVDESIRVRGTRALLKRKTKEHVLTTWRDTTRVANSKKRIVSLFLQMKESQQLRSLLWAWKRHACAPSITSSSSEMTSAMLRSVAAKAKVSPMTYAATRGMTDLVLELIAEGSPVNMKERVAGYSPLHSAAEFGHVDVVEILLDAGANPIATDDEGETPLQKVMKRGADASVEVALTLLRRGADQRYVAEKDGRSLLHLAVDYFASPKLISALLQYKAPIDQQHPTTLRTALHAASFRGDSCIVDIMIKQLELVDVQQFPLDASGQTPLHIACSSSSPDLQGCIVALLKVGFSMNTKSMSGETPLHILCQNPLASAPLIQEVVTSAHLSPEDLDLQDLHGNTALHFACKQNLRGAALKLVSLGAAVYITNEANECPLDLTSPGFGVQLLASIRIQPIIERAKRAHRNLSNCMICKDQIDVGMLNRKISRHCRRCGRMCCSKCASNKRILSWPITDLVSNSVHNEGSTDHKAVEVCHHCAEIVDDPPVIEDGDMV